LALDAGPRRNWDRLGKARAGEGQNREAGDAFAQAASRVPFFYENWSNLATVRAMQARAGDLSSGGWPAARAAVEEGLRRDPANSQLLYTYAFILDATGDPELALAQAVRATGIYALAPTYERIDEPARA